MDELPIVSKKQQPFTLGKSVHWPRSAKRRALFLVSYIVFLTALCWFGYRLYWSFKQGAPLATGKNDIWDDFYPTLRNSGVLTAEFKSPPDEINVVMLGASTIENAWGDVEERLRTGLQREFGKGVRVFNLAEVAHTSRDSALKFSKIADKPFDLVLIYDGFNDCRMNNCPPEMFRDDYTHCAWYRSFEMRRKAGVSQLPVEVLRSLGRAIGMGDPEENLVQYGGDLKTPKGFRQNLEEILQSTREQNGLVLLQTFAYHIPEGYTDEKLKQGDLDFGRSRGRTRCPLQMWGRPADVISCVDAHNRVIRDLAESDPQHTIFVDQQKLLSPNGQYFVDACHFTDTGCRQFVDNLLPAVVQRLRQKRVQSP
ncbi:MAG: hypothetical protein V4719_13480 [Planctomycetota bacterium]